MTALTIRRLGHHGDGIADGPVYAPMTLPDEVVEGTLHGQRLSDVKIVTPSPDRVAAPCPHFKSCGGCQLQHASDSFLESWKQDVVRQALMAQELGVAFLPPHISPPNSRRRARFSVRRTKKGAMVGFHARASDTVIEVPACKILHHDLLACDPALQALASLGASRKHPLNATVTQSDAGVDVWVEGGKPLDGPLRAALGALMAEHSLARLTWEAEVIAMRSPPVQWFDGVAVVPPAGAFLQATQDAEAALRADVMRIAQDAARVVDLFSGCGTFALPLARRAAVHAVEGDGAMIAALDQGWRQASGLKPLTSETRDLFRRPLEPDELASFDAVVIDPPRAGAAAQVDTIAASAVPVVAYVSCNPVSFARDARVLVDAGYHLCDVRVVDQFRWSSHVELVASFKRD